MFDQRGALNPEIVGKPPVFIAKKAGFEVPSDTTCLIAELPGVGRDYPLSREKLSPVRGIDPVVAGPADGRGADPEMDLGGAGPFEQANDLSAGVAPHNRIVHHHQALPFDYLGKGIEFQPDTQLARALIRLDERPADIAILD